MKRNNYDEIIKKVAIGSLSLIVTGGIVAGVMNYNSGKDSAAKSTICAKTIETVKEVKDVKEVKAENHDDAGTYNNPVNVRKWANIYLKGICCNAYDDKGTLKPSYEKRTYTNDAGEEIEIVGRNFIEISANDNKNINYDGRKVYFEIEGETYRVLIDEILNNSVDASVDKEICEVEYAARGFEYVTSGDNKYYVEPEDEEEPSQDIVSYKYQLVSGDQVGIPCDMEFEMELIEKISKPEDTVKYNKKKDIVYVTRAEREDDYIGYNDFTKDLNVKYLSKVNLLGKDVTILEDDIYTEDAIYYVSRDNKLHRINNVKLGANFEYVYATDSKDEIIAEGVASIFFKNEVQFNVIKMKKGFKKLSDKANSEELVYSDYTEWDQRKDEHNMFNNL